MRFLGIDYGEKRVGIAISDEANSFAIPKGVFKNDRELVVCLKKMCEENSITEIVLGESKNYQGLPNQIMKRALVFKEEIERTLGLPVHLEPEYMTSAEAEQIQGKNEMLDASAAALLLKSYLDKHRSV